MTGKTVILGVSGSVACYRACDLARELMRQGADVRVCLTESAAKFISPVLFEALTGNPCLVSAFDEPERGKMAHIELARRASLLLVAPATASSLNKLAAGVADDMLTTVALAFEGPVVVAPAMNPTMFANETTQASLKTLESKGAIIVEPNNGEVACGEQGQGKLASQEQIVRAALSALSASDSLKGKKVLVTSGPTREPIDDVRFISNRSSGKMGSALARAALLMGAEVVVVSGPATTPLPIQAAVHRVETAESMLEVCSQEAPSCDIIIGAAAVADFRVANPISGKIRRSAGLPQLELTPNPDIIAQLAKLAKPGCKVVAFAAEPNKLLEEAKRKLEEKSVSAIVVNDVSDPQIGFDSDLNEVVIVTRDGIERSERTTKLACALWILERIKTL